MIARLILPFLLIVASINAQSEEFLRLKKELEDRIAALRPEAREVAERLKSVFEARLPKEEAKTRLNAVLESASDSAKAALETLKPNGKIDVEVVIPLPAEPVDEDSAERVLQGIVVPGLDRISAAADRLNLTDQTLSDALKNPNLAAQLGVDPRVLDRIEHLANERGLANNTVDSVLNTLRNNLSSIVNPAERSTLEKFALAKNITSLEQLFEKRFELGGPGGPSVMPAIPGVFKPAIEKFRNGSDFIDDVVGGGRNHTGEFVDRFFNGSDGNFKEKIKQRFGNDSSILEKFFSNATDLGLLGNVSTGSLGKLLEGLKSGNSSLISSLFNSTGSSDGIGKKIVEAFKSGNLSSILGGASGKDGSSVVNSLKSFFNISLPGSGGSTDSSSIGNPFSNLGSTFANLPSSIKNLFS